MMSGLQLDWVVLVASNIDSTPERHTRETHLRATGAKSSANLVIGFKITIQIIALKRE